MNARIPPPFDARGRPDVLSRAECIRLLPTVPVGRLVFVHEGEPRAYPMNFAAEGPRIWLRSDTVGAAADIAPDAPVAFEVDSYDAWLHTGWSVLISGRLRWFAEEPDALVATRMPWAPGPRTRVGCLDGQRISGRRISLPAW